VWENGPEKANLIEVSGIILQSGFPERLSLYGVAFLAAGIYLGPRGCSCIDFSHRTPKSTGIPPSAEKKLLATEALPGEAAKKVHEAMTEGLLPRDAPCGIRIAFRTVRCHFYPLPFS
jgi:hypothetical protein